VVTGESLRQLSNARGKMQNANAARWRLNALFASCILNLA
jgi:hypothetical protein